VAAHPKRARRQGAHLVLIDESGALMAPLLRRTLAPRGQTPIFKQQGKHREKVSIIAALTIAPKRQRLGLYFANLTNDYFEQVAVAWFLRQLLQHLRGPVIVVWDRGPMHRGDAIRQVLADFPRLSLEQLPPYAPELNPVEQIWTFLKWSRLCNFAPEDVRELEEKIFQELQTIRFEQKRLHSFFEASKLPFPTRALAS
jgi:putative transposase